MAVIGVCDCGENRDVMRAWESFLIEVEHSHVLRSALAVHCIASSTAGVPQDSSAEEWGRVLHTISGEDDAAVSQQLRAVLQKVAGDVLCGLEQLIVNCESQASILITPNDGGDARDPKLRLKRGPGRVCKRQADLCLLAGCSQDALLRYRMAVELARSNNDALWLAAAMQGQCQ